MNNEENIDRQHAMFEDLRVNITELQPKPKYSKYANES